MMPGVAKQSESVSRSDDTSATKMDAK
jgi:hypothetical protein